MLNLVSSSLCATQKSMKVTKLLNISLVSLQKIFFEGLAQKNLRK